MATKRAKKDGPLTATLRRLIRGDETSLKSLAKATGVERMSLSRFASGERSLRLDKADVLAEYYGLTLTTKGA